MRLFVFVSLIVGYVSADLTSDIVAVADETFVFPCFTQLQCDYKGKPEYEPMKKCLKEVTQQDLQKVVGFLDIGKEDVSKYKNPVDVLTGYYCGLDGKTQEKKFNNLVKGILQYFKPDCARKNGADQCQHFQDLSDCVLHAIDLLYQSGKCDA